MQVVPLSPAPSQTLRIVLGGQNCALSVYTLDGYDFTDLALLTTNTNLYMDFQYNGVDVTETQICLNQKRLLANRQYLGFAGDLMFIDTQGTSDPQFQGLGSRYVLLYLSPADLVP